MQTVEQRCDVVVSTGLEDESNCCIYDCLEMIPLEWLDTSQCSIFARTNTALRDWKRHWERWMLHNCPTLGQASCILSATDCELSALSCSDVCVWSLFSVVFLKVIDITRSTATMSCLLCELTAWSSRGLSLLCDKQHGYNIAIVFAVIK